VVLANGRQQHAGGSGRAHGRGHLSTKRRARVGSAWAAMAEAPMTGWRVQRRRDLRGRCAAVVSVRRDEDLGRFPFTWTPHRGTVADRWADTERGRFGDSGSGRRVRPVNEKDFVYCKMNFKSMHKSIEIWENT
jgi:hypothetical protein